MDSKTLDELFLKTRHLYVKLAEFEDITLELAQAVDRRDEVSVQMLLNMREDPANQLQEINSGLRARLMELPEEEAIRARELLEGAPQAAPEEELLRRCQDLDRRISTRIDGKRSFYNKFR